MRNIIWRKRLIQTSLIITLTTLGLINCTFPTNKSSSLNTPRSVIDWVNFICFGGITYLAASTQIGRPLTESDLGSVFATTTFKLEGNVQNPDYHSRDGDAALLDIGTQVYTLKDYKPTTRLAARQNNTFTLYEADTNPHAKKGSDLLDLEGKVRYIGIVSDQDGITELGAIKNLEQVKALVTLVSKASVNQNQQGGGNRRYFIAFYLADGTVVTRAYWLDTGELARGILLPKAFGHAVEAILRK